MMFSHFDRLTWLYTERLAIAKVRGQYFKDILERSVKQRKPPPKKSVR